MSRWILCLLASCVVASCGAENRPPNTFHGGEAAGTGGSGGASDAAIGTTVTGSTGVAGAGIMVTPREGGFGGSGNAEAGRIIGTLPPDFTKTEAGGYKLGQPITGNGFADTGSDAGVCNEIVGVVRDFRGNDVGGHPDFEHFMGGGTKGLVLPDLGTDSKPVYTGICEVANMPHGGACPDGQMTTGKVTFDQWYRFTD